MALFGVNSTGHDRAGSGFRGVVGAADKVDDGGARHARCAFYAFAALGTADETKGDVDAHADTVDKDDKKKSKEEWEKRRMRGKGKSLKRYVSVAPLRVRHD